MSGRYAQARRLLQALGNPAGVETWACVDVRGRSHRLGKLEPVPDRDGGLERFPWVAECALHRGIVRRGPDRRRAE